VPFGASIHLWALVAYVSHPNAFTSTAAAGNLGAVDDEQTAIGVGKVRQGRHRHAQTGGKGDVADADDTGCFVDSLFKQADNGLRRFGGYRERYLVDRHPVVIGHVLPTGKPAGMFMIRGEHAVARLQCQPLCHHVHRIGGISGHRDLLEITAQEAGGLGPDLLGVFEQRTESFGYRVLLLAIPRGGHGLLHRQR
jgi:hypothetical protein